MKVYDLFDLNFKSREMGISKPSEKIFKKMSADQKIKASLQLYYSARALKKAALKKQYPQLRDIEIEKKVTEIFLYART